MRKRRKVMTTTSVERVVRDEWSFLAPNSWKNLITTWHNEAHGTLALAAPAEAWEAPTAAGHWQVRDVIGHLVDTTESYFVAFDAVRGHGSAPAPVGLRNMARRVNEGSLAFRGTPQADLLARLRSDLDRMLGLVYELTEAEWNSLLVPHTYMGPLPACFYPLLQLMDYTVHSWDIRQGTGRGHGLHAEAADLLVPLGFFLWQTTAEAPPDTEPFTIGVRVSGRNGGDTRIHVRPEGVTCEPGEIDDLPAVLEFDAASLVLTSLGRINGGTTHGDRALADRFRNLHVRI
jgi:uncharacterized protein (TIGR03083 family)